MWKQLCWQHQLSLVPELFLCLSTANNFRGGWFSCRLAPRLANPTWLGFRACTWEDNTFEIMISGINVFLPKWHKSFGKWTNLECPIMFGVVPRFCIRLIWKMAKFLQYSSNNDHFMSQVRSKMAIKAFMSSIVMSFLVLIYKKTLAFAPLLSFT